MDGQPPSGPASQALVTKGKRTSSMTLTGVRVSLDDVGAYTSPSSGGDSPVGTSNIGSGPGGRSILTTSGNSLPMLATHNASSPGSVAGPSPSSGSSSLPGSAASSSSAGASGNTGSGSPLFRSVSNVHSPLSSPREKSSGSEDSPRPRLRTEDSIRRTHSGDKFTRPEKKHRTFGVDLAKVLKRENSKIPFILELLVNHVNAQISKDGMTAPYWLKLFLASTNAVSFVDGFEDNPKEMTEFLTTVVGLRDALEKQTSSTAALPEDTPPHQVLALIQLYLTQLPRPVFGGLMKSAIELGAVTDFFLDPPDSTSGGGALGGLGSGSTSSSSMDPPLSPRGLSPTSTQQDKPAAAARKATEDEWKSSKQREATVSAIQSAVPQQNMSLVRFLLRFLHSLVFTHDRRLLRQMVQRFSVVLLDRDAKGRIERRRDAYLSERANYDDGQHTASVRRDVLYANDVLLETLVLFVDDLFPSTHSDVTKAGKMLIRRKDGEWGVIYSVLCKSTLYVHPDEHTSEPLLSINLQSEASSLPSSAPGSGHNSLTHKLNFSTSPGGSRPSSPDSTMTGSPRDGVSGPQMSIRLVDDSLFGVENCFCIEAQSSRYSDRLFDADSMPESRHLTKYYFVVESVKERHHWIEELRAAMLTSQSLRHVTSLELGVNALHVDRNSSAAAQLLPSGKGASSNMYYCNIHFDNELQARTFSKRDNEGVVEWMAQFHFDDIRHSFFDMSIVIWRMGTSAKEKDVEIGRITMPFHTLAQTTLNKENVGAGGNWYQLESGIGKVRIELRYTVERICPLPTYNSLFVFLLNTLNADTNMVNLIYDALNGDSTAQAKSEFAGSLVRFFLGIGQITKFLRTLTRCEIFATDQPTIIFRGNTMATKAMDQFMKICCEDYLHETMDEVAYDMFSCTQSCEIDPTQMDKGEDLMKNWRRLKSFIDRVTKSVFESSATVPRDLVVIFEGIRVAMADKFGDADQNKGLTAISGFIFLRLFSAALQGPHLHPFLLVPDIPEERSRRLFTLVSKTVQTLANLRLFSQKEEHLMNMMNNSFEEDHVLDKMRKFLTEVSTVYYGPKTASDIDKTMALYDAPIDIAAIVPMLKHSSVFVTFPPNHGPTISSTVHPAASAGVGVRVDIERELAFINHHLQKKRPYLAKKAESNAVLKPLITKLFAIIDDVQKNEQTVIDNAQRQGFQVSTGEAADE